MNNGEKATAEATTFFAADKTKVFSSDEIKASKATGADFSTTGAYD